MVSIAASSDRCFSILSREGGLDSLPLHMSNKGFQRPYIAQAQRPSSQPSDISSKPSRYLLPGMGAE